MSPSIASEPKMDPHMTAVPVLVSPGPQTTHFLLRIPSQNKLNNCCYNINFIFKRWGLPFYNTEHAELPSRVRILFSECISWPLFSIFLLGIFVLFLFNFSELWNHTLWLNTGNFLPLRFLFLCSSPHSPHLFHTAGNCQHVSKERTEPFSL